MPGVRVSVDTQSKVDLSLELGDMSEAVTVRRAALLKTDRADVATTFEAEQITSCRSWTATSPSSSC